MTLVLEVLVDCEYRSFTYNRIFFNVGIATVNKVKELINLPLLFLWWSHWRCECTVTVWCVCQVNNNASHHPCITSKGLNYKRSLHINVSVKHAIVRTYSVFSSNCVSVGMPSSPLSMTGSSFSQVTNRLSFHRLGLPEKRGNNIVNVV